MLVYRLERESGMGVYTGGGPGSGSERYPMADCEYDVYAKNHPNPNRDPLLQEAWGKANSRSYYFGFESIQQFEDWFPPENHINFVKWNQKKPYEKISLIIFEVDDKYVVLGEKQVMFLREKAKSKEVINSFDQISSEIISK